MSYRSLSENAILKTAKEILGISDYTVMKAYILPDGVFCPIGESIDSYEDAGILICNKLRSKGYFVDDFLDGEWEDNILDELGSIRIDNNDEESTIYINKVRPTNNALQSLESWVDNCFIVYSRPITLNAYNYESAVFSPRSHTSNDIINSIIKFYSTSMLTESTHWIITEDKENYKDTYHFVAERFDRDETTGGTVEAVSEKQAYYLARKMFPRCKIYDMTLISKGNTDRQLKPVRINTHPKGYVIREDEETGLVYIILRGRVIATFSDRESAEEVYGELLDEK